MRRHVGTTLSVVAFVACIPLANWAILHLGADNGRGHPRTMPVGFGLVAPSGVLFAGALFTLRDLVHRRIGTARTLAVIGASAPLTAIVASSAVAVASIATFLVAEICDLAIYQRLRRHGHTVGVLGSNLASTAVDSILFLALAFGAAQAVTGSLGMTVGKLEASLLTFAALVAVARMTSAVTGAEQPSSVGP